MIAGDLGGGRWRVQDRFGMRGFASEEQSTRGRIVALQREVVKSPESHDEDLAKGLAFVIFPKYCRKYCFGLSTLVYRKNRWNKARIKEINER